MGLVDQARHRTMAERISLLEQEVERLQAQIAGLSAPADEVAERPFAGEEGLDGMSEGTVGVVRPTDPRITRPPNGGGQRPI